MKINELEQRIEHLEIESKELEEQAKEARFKLSKMKDKAVANVGEIVLGKYLKDEEKKYFEQFYSTKAELKEEHSKEKSDDDKIKKLDETGDKLRDNIEGFIFNSLSKATDDEKIVAGQYLYDKGVLYGCGDLGSFKNPTTCGGCHKNEAISEKLGLRKYSEFVGDRCYRIPQEVKDKAVNSLSKGLIQENGKAEIDKLLDRVSNNKKEIEDKNKLKSAYWALNESKTDYEKVEKEMPEFFDEITEERDKSRVEFAVADSKKNIGVIIRDDWNYYGSGGCEYGVTIIAFRDGKTKEEYFQYRDAYSPDKDDWRYHFKEAEIVKVTNDNVTIKLKSNRERPFEITRTFPLAKTKQQLETILSKEEQTRFIEKFNDAEREIIESNSRPNATMPDYDASFGMTVGGSFTGRSVPYETPQIVSKYMDSKQGLGALVVKAQIDHGSGRGKQYGWYGYKISKDGKYSVVASDNAYQLELKDGKRIVMKAKDLLKGDKK